MNYKMLIAKNASLPESYNKYFLLYEEDNYFLVDNGSGDGFLSQLEEYNIDWKDIKDIFLNHKDMDHIMGVIWMIRMIGQAMNKGKYYGEANIYANKELIEILQNTMTTLLQEKDTKFIGNRIHLIEVDTKKSYKIIGNKTTFFNSNPAKDGALGFTMYLKDDEKFTFMDKKHLDKK